MNERIAEITARCKGATPGPWDICLGSGDHVCTAIKHDTEEDGAMFIADCLPDYALKMAKADHRPNMVFIAHAREDIPYLLTQLAERDKEIERLREAQRWIPITEQYPPDKSSVLACVKYSWNDSEYLMMLSFAKNGTEIDDYDLAGQTNVFYEYDSEYGYCPYDNVTHWMPLPEPPEKGE